MLYFEAVVILWFCCCCWCCCCIRELLQIHDQYIKNRSKCISMKIWMNLFCGDHYSKRLDKKICSSVIDNNELKQWLLRQKAEKQTATCILFPSVSKHVRCHPSFLSHSLSVSLFINKSGVPRLEWMQKQKVWENKING